VSHLHLLAGPNGAGKTTLYQMALHDTTGLPFVNADEIAKVLAGGRPVDDEISVQAAQAAAKQRDAMIGVGISFVAETVFSHPSKLALLEHAKASGYTVHLHVVVVPVELSVLRVQARVAGGGHPVPEDKIRERHERLWPIVASAVSLVDEALIYDNSRAHDPHRLIARFEHGTGRLVGEWPAWAPTEVHPASFGGGA
jgi:predicted ABC-type ATPase